MTLSYHPLPEPALAAARGAFVHLGYSERAVLSDYRFLDATGATVRTNALAFADPVRRTPGEYAACSVHSLGPEANDGLEWVRSIVDVLARTAAPFHLLHSGGDGDGRFALWTATPATGGVGPGTDAYLVDSAISPGRLREALGRYSGDLAPTRVADVKQGRARFTSEAFAYIRPSQLTQLSLWLEDVNGPVLRDRFAKAVAVLRDAQERTRAWDDNTTTELAVRLLGALVLADTGGLDIAADGSTRLLRRELSVRELFARGAEQYPQYFPPVPNVAEDALESACASLSDLSYAVFEPQMLVTLYRAAYTREQRKQLGRFDTPMYLTRRILEHVPLELLRPEDRCVCDMAAGWGSFLIAAHDRMARLGDMAGRRLSSHLLGNDKDHSAAQLARFGLLLSTQTDSWRVDTANAFDWTWLNTHRPSVIVGNPPFGGNRKQPSAHVTRRAEEQEANLFVRRAVERLAPGGMLAMIVPRSFFVSDSASEARQLLLRTCDLQEVWDLPQDVFQPDARVETSVIFARRLMAGRRVATRPADDQEVIGGAEEEPAMSRFSAADAGGASTRTAGTRALGAQPVVARMLQRGAVSLEAFRRDGAFTRTQIQPTQAAWDSQSRRAKSAKARTTHMMDVRFVLSEGEWQSIRERCVPLESLAAIIQGAIVGDPQKRHRSVHGRPSERVPWLPNAQKVVPRRFVVNYDAATSMLYPAGVEWPRWDDRDKLAGQKVLIASINNPSWGQRVTVAIERRGYYVSDNFWVLVPKPEGARSNYTLEVTAAVVGWLVGNAWVVEHLRSPKIPIRPLRSLPVPAAFTVADRDALTSAVHRLEAAAEAGAPEPPDALATIDRVLRAAYKLDDETYDRLCAVAFPQHAAAPDTGSLGNASATWEVSGVVTAVDGADTPSATLTLALPGFDGPQRVAFGPNMPGWLLRPGTPFQTTVTPEARAEGRVAAASDFGTFSVGPYAYMDEEEVLDVLAAVLSDGRTLDDGSPTVTAR
jgi:hypothetical protein